MLTVHEAQSGVPPRKSVYSELRVALSVSLFLSSLPLALDVPAREIFICVASIGTLCSLARAPRPSMAPPAFRASLFTREGNQREPREGGSHHAMNTAR